MKPTKAEEPPLESTATATPPRKRRRRTGAGGAQDDCFACRKRAVPCDRKRPYCTPCIENGKECSGYKTTLTWGVGVASRGKLRGLSCPVANKAVDGNINGVLAGGVVKRGRKNSAAQVQVETLRGTPPRTSPTQQLALPTSPSSYTRPYTPTSAPIPVPQPQNGWQVSGYRVHTSSRDGGHHMGGTQASPPRLETALSPAFEHSAVPMSAASVGSYAEDWHSPLEYPHTPGSMIFPNPYAQMDPYIDSALSSSAESYQQSLGSNLDSLQSNNSYDESGTIDPSQAELSGYQNILFDDSSLPPQGQSQKEGYIESTGLSLMDSRFSNPFYYLSPRLQSLMTYYDQHICPFLVAFDGPDNPYRMHIMQLATQNEGLQNAIAALATNNMRMRRYEARNSGFVEGLTDALNGQDSSQPTAEETCYKQLSIEQLNMQLTSPQSAQDDSVLGTLLILCLFHVCDSGFSKFKTQLAGVQKLMSLRSPQTQSNFTGWVEMFFTWFDVMTSAVNDREAQIQGEHLDMMDFSANLGALEQFSGCDGRLFKLIARLGRLNLLSQGRPVGSHTSEAESTPRAMGVPNRHRKPSGPKRPMGKSRANRHLSALDYEFIDGNGWGSPIISSDDEAASYTEEDPTRPAFDERREFWAEWHDVRIRLHQWQMDASAMLPSSSGQAGDPTQLGPEQRDMAHISESFRASALLYITRLAHPFLPSSAPEFQCLVNQAMYHMSALPVTSCVNKFLLWPLFITGTECVDAGHRNVIRQRCVEIQRESGFFNNISGLEVLERVWKDGDVNLRGPEAEVMARRRDSEIGRGMQPQRWQALRWRRAMDRVDGEYIVI